VGFNFREAAQQFGFTHEEHDTGGTKFPRRVDTTVHHPETGEPVGSARYFPPKRRGGPVHIDDVRADAPGAGSAVLNEIESRHPGSTMKFLHEIKRNNNNPDKTGHAHERAGAPSDWDTHYPNLAPTVHRGFSLRLPSHAARTVNSSSSTVDEHLKALHSEMSGSLGMHWTENEHAAQQFAHNAVSDHRTDVPVVLHATTPERKDIETRKDHLYRGGVFAYGDEHSPENEVPVRKGRTVKVTGISWRPDAAHPDADEHGWVHHTYPEPMHHTASVGPEEDDDAGSTDRRSSDLDQATGPEEPANVVGDETPAACSYCGSTAFEGLTDNGRVRQATCSSCGGTMSAHDGAQWTPELIGDPSNHPKPDADPRSGGVGGAAAVGMDPLVRDTSRLAAHIPSTTCETCKGKGTVSWMDEDPDWQGEPEENPGKVHTDTCDDCGGSGSMPETSDEEIAASRKAWEKKISDSTAEHVRTQHPAGKLVTYDDIRGCGPRCPVGHEWSKRREPFHYTGMVRLATVEDDDHVERMGLPLLKHGESYQDRLGKLTQHYTFLNHGHDQIDSDYMDGHHPLATHHQEHGVLHFEENDHIAEKPDVKARIAAHLSKHAEVNPPRNTTTISIGTHKTDAGFHGEGTLAYYSHDRRRDGIGRIAVNRRLARRPEDEPHAQHPMDSGGVPRPEGGYFSESGDSSLLDRSLTHEYGHLRDHELHNLKDNDYEGGKRRGSMFKELSQHIPGATPFDSSFGIGENPKHWVKQNREHIINHVGTYASTNDDELIAELYAEHHHSPNPSEAANVVGRHLDAGGEHDHGNAHAGEAGTVAARTSGQGVHARGAGSHREGAATPGLAERGRFAKLTDPETHEVLTRFGHNHQTGQQYPHREHTLTPVKHAGFKGYVEGYEGQHEDNMEEDREAYGSRHPNGGFDEDLWDHTAPEMNTHERNHYEEWGEHPDQDDYDDRHAAAYEKAKQEKDDAVKPVAHHGGVFNMLANEMERDYPSWHTKGEIRKVDVSKHDVYATQPHVVDRHVNRYLKNPGDTVAHVKEHGMDMAQDMYPGTHRPMMVKHENNLFTVEGHHRVASALLRKEPVEAMVYDADKHGFPHYDDDEDYGESYEKHEGLQKHSMLMGADCDFDIEDPREAHQHALRHHDDGVCTATELMRHSESRRNPKEAAVDGPDWCTWRRAAQCTFPNDRNNTLLTIPQVRGACPWNTRYEQQICPISEPGPQALMQRKGSKALSWDEIGDRHPEVYGDSEIHGDAADGADGPGIGDAVNYLAHERPGHLDAEDTSVHDLDFHEQTVHPRHIDYKPSGVNDPRVTRAREGYRQHPHEMPPLVLVKRHNVYQVADGHHRAEAAHGLNIPVRAYVAESPHPDEPFYDGDKAPFYNAKPIPKERKRKSRMPKNDGDPNQLKLFGSSDEDTSYRMQHQAPDADYGAPLHDVHGMMPDFYEHPEYYHAGQEHFHDSASVIRSARGKPEKMISVYRALPAEHAGKGIRPGDWVSTSKDYARGEGRWSDDPKHDYPVIHARVPAKHLHTEGDVHEWGYNGPDVVKPRSVAFKGGYHQEVRQRADGTVQPVQRKAKSPERQTADTLKEKGYTFSHFGDTVAAYGPDENWAGRVRVHPEGSHEVEIDPAHEHMHAPLEEHMRNMLKQGSVKTAATMYHWAPQEAREDIKEHGLDHTRSPHFDPNSHGPHGVFMHHNRAVADDWVPDISHTHDLYEVNTHGLNLHPDPYDTGDASYSEHAVSPERLRRLESALSVPQSYEFARVARQDPEFGFHVTAAWSDVRNKAKRIRAEGKVMIKAATNEGLAGMVEGDHGTYENMITYRPGTRKIADWSCNCEWGDWAWKRIRFHGRQCSHSLALQYEAQSRGMFGREVHLGALIFGSSETLDERAGISDRPISVIARSLVESEEDPGDIMKLLMAYGLPHSGALQVLAEEEEHRRKCPFCGGGLSEKAIEEHKCPHCGHPIGHIASANMTAEEEDERRKKHHHTVDTRRHAPEFGRGVPGWIPLPIGWCSQCGGWGCGHCGGTGQVAEDGYGHDANAVPDQNGDEGQMMQGGISDTSSLRIAKDNGPTCSGVALKAADTGRVLMLQRGLGEDHPAAGKWEIPGGHHEPGDTTSLHAGIREFEEEVGQPFPEGGTVHHTWTSPDGVYQGHVVVIPSEKDLSMKDGRVIPNPDDPKGDGHEQAAWWDIDHARDNPALRDEVREHTPWDEIASAGSTEKTASAWDPLTGEGDTPGFPYAAPQHSNSQNPASTGFATSEDPRSWEDENGIPDHLLPSNSYDSIGYYGMLHEQPEPALPSTDGGDPDGYQPPETYGAIPDVEESLSPNQFTGAATDIVAAFQATAGAKSIMASTPASTPGGGDVSFDFAAAARQYLAQDKGLQKSALKDFSFPEQQELINEGKAAGVRARNFSNLQIEGTHYEALGHALGLDDEDAEGIFS
jgi:8-oxo-dGTP pyrophosphatase MutT (NUDIX family)